MEYKEGDCPVAEARCSRYELSIFGGPSWYGDQSAYVTQIVEAFHKVTRNLDALRKLDAA